jgi:hypothetical protein
MAMPIVAICFWVAQILGTLIGLMYTFIAGLGKLLPCHPMYAQLKSGFDTQHGPFFGLPGDLLRWIIGLAGFCAGAGTLVVLWCPHNLLGDLVEPSQVLLLCASCGLITTSLGAAWVHIAVEGNPGAMTMLLPMHVTILICRLQVTPLDAFKDRGLANTPLFSKFPYDSLFEEFLILCAVGLVGAVISRTLFGKPTAEIQETMKAQGKAEE